jgi:hypothetical protein
MQAAFDYLASVERCDKGVCMGPSTWRLEWESTGQSGMRPFCDDCHRKVTVPLEPGRRWTEATHAEDVRKAAKTLRDAGRPYWTEDGHGLIDEPRSTQAKDKP